MVTTLDLRPLAVDRGGGEVSARRPPRHVGARYLLPLAIVVGFVSLLAWSVRDSLLPSKPVTVAPVVLMRGEIRESGRPLFQAAGWVEPRPSPVKVPALAEGVIERLLVVAGQAVEAGQPVATLVEADARLALEDIGCWFPDRWWKPATANRSSGWPTAFTAERGDKRSFWETAATNSWWKWSKVSTRWTNWSPAAARHCGTATALPLPERLRCRAGQ